MYRRPVTAITHHGFRIRTPGPHVHARKPTASDPRYGLSYMLVALGMALIVLAASAAYFT